MNRAVAGATSARWRWVGLAAAVAVYVIAVFTFGLGLVLSPASLALSVIAVRRLPRPRGLRPWLGVVANAGLLIMLVLWVIPALVAGGY
jgi:hypothetical protein